MPEHTKHKTNSATEFGREKHLGDGLPNDQLEWTQGRSLKESCFKAVKVIDSSF